MAEIIKKPRGTIDYFGEDMRLLKACEDLLLDESRIFACKEVRLPIFEESKLFHRSVGESSDIVQKETFDLAKKGDKDFTLRPEFTASVVRLIVENKLYTSPDMPIRLTYAGPVYRYERPQAGRLREFRQYGAEFVDAKIDFAAQLDCFLLSLRALERVLNKKVHVKINYLGSFSSRERYKKELYNYFSPLVINMCDDCKRRIELNPLRILDCKVEEDHQLALNAPKITDFLNDDDRQEFEKIIAVLKNLGVDFEVDSGLVRGLDYYTGLVFELYDVDNLQLGALGGGGKYSSLMSQIGGPDYEGIGFSLGIERLLLALSEERKKELLTTDNLDYFLIDFKRDGKALEIADSLRSSSFSVGIASYSRSLNGALKMADRLNAKYSIILTQDDKILLKNMTTREQNELTLTELLRR